MVHPKDAEKKANVVYQIPCSSCSAKFSKFIRQTSQTLDTRLKEHKRAVQRRYKYICSGRACVAPRPPNGFQEFQPKKQIAIRGVTWNLGLFNATTQLTMNRDRYPQYISPFLFKIVFIYTQ